jgi:hypothetical protein
MSTDARNLSWVAPSDTTIPLLESNYYRLSEYPFTSHPICEHPFDVNNVIADDESAPLRKDESPRFVKFTKTNRMCFFSKDSTKNRNVLTEQQEDQANPKLVKQWCSTVTEDGSRVVRELTPSEAYSMPTKYMCSREIYEFVWRGRRSAIHCFCNTRFDKLVFLQMDNLITFLWTGDEWIRRREPMLGPFYNAFRRCEDGDTKEFRMVSCSPPCGPKWLQSGCLSRKYTESQVQNAVFDWKSN